jgi:hypothetical protein
MIEYFKLKLLGSKISSREVGIFKMADRLAFLDEIALYCNPEIMCYDWGPILK